MLPNSILLLLAVITVLSLINNIYKRLRDNIFNNIKFNFFNKGKEKVDINIKYNKDKYYINKYYINKYLRNKY